jgi:hypothetical protein
VKEKIRASAEASAGSPRVCSLCGVEPAGVRVPFAVGRQDTPPRMKEYRILGIGPRRKRFVQRHRWVWHLLWLCRTCGGAPASDRLWSAIQSHPETRRLVGEGFNETRLDCDFEGAEGEVTFTEEPV